jgi:hypothetical protein
MIVATLHTCSSELVKKKCMLVLLGDPPILKFQRLCFLKENGLIIMGGMPFLKLKN